ncbi:MAG: hypothetical protein O2783_07225 [Chloroflexi bacterium]|nr:hypothetical protein [Chloroflexota bacterium]
MPELWAQEEQYDPNNDGWSGDFDGNRDIRLTEERIDGIVSTVAYYD